VTVQPTITGLFSPSESEMSEEEINGARPDLLTPVLIEGELRIRDVDLAVRLGFTKPANIRKLIIRHIAALAGLGTISTVETVNRGQKAQEYYLNRRQAIYITTKSETEKATDTTIEIIDKFDAYERGAISSQKPMSREEFLAQAVLMADQTIKEQADKIAKLTPKAEGFDRIADADGSLNITEAAKALQRQPKDLFTYLATNGWTYRRAGSGTWLGYQARTNAETVPEGSHKDANGIAEGSHKDAIGIAEGSPNDRKERDRDRQIQGFASCCKASLPRRRPNR
jgi:phage antirepressor YoqD-like protein